MRASFSKLSQIWVGLVIFCALAHPVLRLSDTGLLTPIRVIIVFWFLYVLRNRRVQVASVALVALLLIECCKAFLFPGPVAQALIYIGHFFLLSAFLIALGVYLRKVEFHGQLYAVVGVFVFVSTLLVFSSVVEYMAGWSWPGTENDKGVSSVFYNINDYSAFLVAYIAVLAVYIDSLHGALLKKFLCLLGLAAAIWVVVLNGSRAALGGVVLILAAWGVTVYFPVLKRFFGAMAGLVRIRLTYLVLVLSLVVATTFFIVLAMSGKTIEATMLSETWNRSLNAISTALWHISHLEYTGVYIGSINDRINGAVLSLGALLDTYGFGIGLGGTKKLIQASGITYNASSLHFFALQILVELGFLGVFIFIWMLHYVCRGGGKVRLMGKYFAVVVLVFAGASQSEGFVSNFGTWGVILFLFFFWRINSKSMRFSIVN